MTNSQKESIVMMRENGMTYADIARHFDLSVNTVKSCIRRAEIDAHRANENTCPNCGEAIHQNMKHKRRKFCSDPCRLSWWHKHKALLKSSSARICSGCGAQFMATPFAEVLWTSVLHSHAFWRHSQ